MRYVYLSGSALAAALTLSISACNTDGKVVLDCTIPNAQTRTNDTVKIETTAAEQGVACDNARKLAKAGQPLPTPQGQAAAPVVPIVPVKTTDAYGKDGGKKPELFSSSFVPGKDNAAELIATVDPKKRQEELISRLSSVDKSRDPFGVIPGTVKIPNFSEPKARPLRTFPRKNAPVAIRNLPPIQTVVAPPRTEEASGVQVTGVIEVAGTKFAIVAVPGETTTRYVSAGTRVANNLVLVKRIDNNAGSPTVILEQNGVEVARPVGKVAVAAVPQPTVSAPQVVTPGIPAVIIVPNPTSTTQPATQRIVAPGDAGIPGLPIINNTPRE